MIATILCGPMQYARLRWACQYWVLKTIILIELVADIYWQKIGGATNELALNGCPTLYAPSFPCSRMLEVLLANT